MLVAASRLTNIEKSLNTYLNNQLVTIAGFTVIFPRETWPNDTMPGQWIEVNYIPLSEEFPTTRVHVGWGSNRMLLVNANCFEQRQEQIGQGRRVSGPVHVECNGGPGDGRTGSAGRHSPPRLRHCRQSDGGVFWLAKSQGTTSAGRHQYRP